MPSCPHCGAATREGQKFCSTCGKALSTVPPVTARAQLPAQGTNGAATGQAESGEKPKTERKSRNLVKILGIAAAACCISCFAWAAVHDALTTQNPKAILPTAAALCESAFTVREEPTQAPRGVETPTVEIVTAEPRVVAPALSLIRVKYKDVEWKLAKLLDNEPRSADDVRSLVCIEQTRGGRMYTDRAMGYRIYWHIRLITWPDGIVIAKETFSGGKPPSSKTGAGDRYGSKPSKFALKRWLSWDVGEVSGRTRRP